MQIWTDERKILASYPEAGRVIAELKRFGLQFDFTPDDRIPDLSRWVQVRPTEQQVMLKRVQRYKAGYLNHDPFPPIVKTIDGVGIDGAHRVAAAMKAGLTTLPQFRVKINYEEATDSQRRLLREFGGAENNDHGLGMTKAGNAALIREAIKDGKTVKQIAADLKVPASQVSAILAEDKGTTRLTNLGIKIEGGLKLSHVQKIGFKSRELDNAVLRPLAILIRDGNLTVGQEEDLLRRLGKKDSIEDKVAVIAEAARDHGPRMRNVVSRGGMYGGKLRQALKRPLELCENPSAVTEHDPRYVEEHVKVLELAVDRFTAALKQQREALTAASIRDGYGAVTPRFRSGTDGS